MPQLLSRLNDFLAELQRRRVYRVLALYCVAAFVILQLADIAFEPLGVADAWFVLLLAVIVAGLPLAAALGWMYDLTESGVRRTRSEDADRSGTMLRIWLPTLAAGLLAGATLWATAWWMRDGEPGPAGQEAEERTPVPPLDARRIAVLYFDDLSPEGDLGYLAAGLSEALADELGAVEGLEVVPQVFLEPTRDRAVPLDSIVQKLGVGSVVAGSVTGLGDSVRATIRLLDGRSTRLVHSRVVEGSLEDLFALQDSVAATVARALRRHLGREIRLRDARQGATSQEAWTSYRHAVELMAMEERFRRQETGDPRAVLMRADSMLDIALRLDPQWLQPGLARVRVACELAELLGPHPGALNPAWARRALERIDRTLTAHPQSAEAYALRGWVRLRLAYSPGATGTPAEHLNAAEVDLNEAIKLRPDLPDAYWTLSEVLVNKRRFAEAVEAAEHARRVDVFLEAEDPALLNEFDATLQLGPLDEAIHLCDEGHRRFPANPNFVRCQLLILGTFPQVRPDVDRAWALLDVLVAVADEQNRDVWRMFGATHVAQVLARAGLADSARAVLELARGDSTPPMLASHEAKVLLQLGDREQAVELLKSWLTFDPDTAFVAQDWWFEGLHDYPPFRDLVGLDRANR